MDDGRAATECGDGGGVGGTWQGSSRKAVGKRWPPSEFSTGSDEGVREGRLIVGVIGSVAKSPGGSVG